MIGPANAPRPPSQSVRSTRPASEPVKVVVTKAAPTVTDGLAMLILMVIALPFVLWILVLIVGSIMQAANSASHSNNSNSRIYNYAYDENGVYKLCEVEVAGSPKCK